MNQRTFDYEGTANVLRLLLIMCSILGAMMIGLVHFIRRDTMLDLILIGLMCAAGAISLVLCRRISGTKFVATGNAIEYISPAGTVLVPWKDVREIFYAGHRVFVRTSKGEIPIILPYLDEPKSERPRFGFGLAARNKAAEELIAIIKEHAPNATERHSLFKKKGTPGKENA